MERLSQNLDRHNCRGRDDDRMPSWRRLKPENYDKNRTEDNASVVKQRNEREEHEKKLIITIM